MFSDIADNIFTALLSDRSESKAIATHVKFQLLCFQTEQQTQQSKALVAPKKCPLLCFQTEQQTKELGRDENNVHYFVSDSAAKQKHL